MIFVCEGSDSGKLDVELSLSDLEMAEMLAKQQRQSNNNRTMIVSVVCAPDPILGTVYIGPFIPPNEVPLFSVIF